MRKTTKGTVDGVSAVFGDVHHKKNGINFTVVTDAIPVEGSNMEQFYGRNPQEVSPYVIKSVTKIEDNKYRVVARMATSEDYE